MEIHATATLNVSAAGLKLPTGRSQAEEAISAEFPRLIQPSLLAIPADSSSTIEDLINRGELSLHSIGELALSARRFPPAFSPDLALMTAAYTIDLKTISAALVRHRQAADTPRTLLPVPSASYTGIIIFADTEVPIHGRNLRAAPLPCLFPKIWDSEMNLIYERNMVEPRIARDQGIILYTGAAGVFRANPSGLDDTLTARVGSNPLRILARGVFGVLLTDPVIDRDDALLIISSEENRRLLREGKVAFVLSDSALRSPLKD
ncbi:polymerase [Breznakiella homolactica]|uniref:Polymerase n=2 Tax=Breznakiella homolactica TaxID=2798577 RepID=A0A7T7XRZ1_9SPIR|nr:polymerase [Breznakiella homolactica]